MEKPTTTGRTLATLQARRDGHAIAAVVAERPSVADFRAWTQLIRQHHIDTARAATKAGW